MIEVVVNSTCPYCTKQLNIMSQSFQDQYKIIRVGSAEWNAYDLASEVEIVPYISIRVDGKVTYKKAGFHPEATLKKALLRSP